MADEATLLFGVGATKAGTSWLYRYLAAHPECHLRAIKELHFFDALDEGRQAAQLDALTATRDRLMRGDGGAGPAERARRIADIDAYGPVLKSGDAAAYMEYLNGGRTDQRLIADITPAYALLSEGRLGRMACMSSDVRFVYLLRDPVARLWSHVRMIARRRSTTGHDVALRAGQVLERALSGAEMHIVRRGDYRAALTRLRSAVAPSRLFTAFYETLFQAETVTRLCGFLGLSSRPADFRRRVHAGVPVEMTDEQRDRAAVFLRPQYEFVEACLGRLPAAWEANRVGV